MRKETIEFDTGEMSVRASNVKSLPSDNMLRVSTVVQHIMIRVQWWRVRRN
jgi:hypothetical protein